MQEIPTVPKIYQSMTDAQLAEIYLKKDIEPPEGMSKKQLRIGEGGSIDGLVSISSDIRYVTVDCGDCVCRTLVWVECKDRVGQALHEAYVGRVGLQETQEPSITLEDFLPQEVDEEDNEF